MRFYRLSQSFLTLMGSLMSYELLEQLKEPKNRAENLAT
jgi:hypothetical protein